MSKIYEALLRAEQERADQEKAQRDGATVDPQTPVAAAQPIPQQPEPIAHIPPAYVPEPPVSFDAPHVPSAPRAIYSAVVPSPLAPSAAMPSAAMPVAPAAPAYVEPVYVAPAYVAPANVPPVEPRPGPAPVSAIPVAATPVAEPAIPSDDRNFSPDKVRRCLWSPSLDTLPALEDRGAPVEQFRSLRSRMFEFRDLNKLKSIMVSSGLPQEGKSFVAANLAVSFARHKAARVLLIDGDMRRSTLHKLLGASAEVGLAEYLSGTAGLLDVMQQMETSEDHAPLLQGLASLTFIPGGSDSERAADLSGNPRFAQLMAAVAPYYDWIVVDSAPVNVVADGVNLARSCDGVLLVARGGVTKYETAQRALVELKASQILGFVLNAVVVSQQTGGYYGYESYDSLTK